MKPFFSRLPLTETNFRTALINCSIYGGAIVVATTKKDRWLAYKALHATPCARVYIKTPIKDTVSGCTWLLVDDRLPRRKVVRNWLNRCNKPPADIRDVGANMTLVDHTIDEQIPRTEILDVPY